MELSFILVALRKRPWLVVLCVLLGALPAFGLRRSTSLTYDSQAVLLISPPVQGAAGSSNSDDRYVVNQVNVLMTDALAARVATALGPGYSAQSVRATLRVTQRPGTDLVDVFSSAATPTLAQSIAHQYVVTYIQDLRTRADASQAPDISELGATLADLQKKIETLNSRIATAVLAFPRSGSGELVPAAVADPISVSERDALQAQYNKTLDSKTQLDLVSKQTVTSDIVQDATLPTVPVNASKRLLFVAGGFAGAVLGVIAAVVAARMSGTVLDQVHIEEILGVDVARSVGHARSLAKSPQAALDSLPNSCMEAIDQLCVRAESAAVLGRALTVAVIGTQRSAGSTTLAMAMAGRYANSGLSVVVIDGDPKQPDVSTTFDTSQTTGVHGLLALVAAEPREGEPGWWQRRGLPIFAASSVADVRILGIGTEGVLRRDEVPRLLSAAGTAGQVVIIDCGPLLEAASTVEFARQVDAIVLAVPQRIQRVGTLEVVARQLAERRGELLPVLTSPSRRRRSARAQQRFAKAKAKANAKARSKSAATAIVDDSLQPDPLAADELASVLEPVRTHRWSRDIDDRGVGTGRVPPRPMTSMTSSTEDRDPPPADDDNALDDDPAATFAQRETARRLRPKSAR